MRTDSKEVTTKGYLRNFILGKKNRFLIPVSDDANGKYFILSLIIKLFELLLGRGILSTSVEFRTSNVLPLMNIDKATYGHPSDNQKVFYFNFKTL